MTDIVIIGSLVILFLVTQYFWMKHTQTLVDKLMSRSYSEYSQSEKILKTKPVLPDIKVAPGGPNELGILN